MQDRRRTTLLVPLDGSELAEAALPYAESLARSLGLGLRLVSVVDTGPDTMLVYAESKRDSLVHAEQDTRKRYLETVRRPLDEREMSTSVIVLDGDPVERILAAADETDVELLVIGTHGRGGIERLYLGSVADKVMRLATCPTVMIPVQESVAAAPVNLRRIVVPLDGSSLAEAALPWAQRLAVANKGTLVLVRIQPIRPSLTMAGPYMPELAEIQTELERLAEGYLQTMEQQLEADVPVETVVLRGAPAPELVHYLQTSPSDLVVMTTHGRGGLKRLLLGSTADRLVRSGFPVLLIRATSA
jgi:nucleotide-binding universal stress UspA family protein